MRPLVNEKKEVIEEILNKYSHSLHINIKKPCKIFKPELMAAYLENKFTENQKKKFEKHLFDCPYCIKIYKNLINEINILYKSKLKKTSQNLLHKALDFVDKEYKKKKINFNLTKISLKLKNKGFELLEAINLNNLNPVPMPILRGEKSLLLKEIHGDGEFNKNNYQFNIQFLSNNTFNMQINFSDSLYKMIKDQRLKISSNNTNINKKIEKIMNLTHLEKDSYSFFINQSVLIKIEAL